jgi:hypothetical protein
VGLYHRAAVASWLLPAGRHNRRGPLAAWGSERRWRSNGESLCSAATHGSCCTRVYAYKWQASMDLHMETCEHACWTQGRCNTWYVMRSSQKAHQEDSYLTKLSHVLCCYSQKVGSKLQ